MNETVVFWIVLVVGLLLPMAHVLLSPKSGAWGPPAGSRCPFGPRVGWLVMIVMLGPIGWIMYMRKRGRAPAPGRKS